MNFAATAALSVLLLTSGASAFAQDTGPQTQDSPPSMTPAQREAATARAAGFQVQLKAALTQPVDPLYLAALKGSADDRWVWGLALTAKRYDTESVPPTQLKLFRAYSAKVEKAKDKYAKSHKNDALPDRTMEDWVVPTPEEAEATKIVHAINTAEPWLNSARDGVDGMLLDQSLDCMKRLDQQLGAEEMMNQLMAGLGMDIGAIVSELADSEKDDEDLDNDAVCGGADAWSANKAMFKAIYQPEFRISVSKGEK